MINLSNHLFSIGLIALLLASHYATRYINAIPGLNRQHFTSFAGGVTAAYVFLHMLPELVESRDRIHQLLSAVTMMSPFKDLVVFMIALLGFESYYALERYTANTTLTKHVAHHRHFVLNMAMYSIYNFIITYTLMERITMGRWYAVLFTLAISLHFVITDNRFKRYFFKLFDLKSHLILFLALIIGYISSFIIPVDIYMFALLTAFLSGALLYTTFAEELALNRHASMGYFCAGSVIMAALLSVLLIKL